MGIMDFIKGELLEIIEWTDDSRDTLSWRFPDEDKAIKNGAQLIVRESQVAQFVYVGEFGDTFKPGKHTLTTDNIPVLTKIKSWPYGFNSPFKADVYFVVTRLFTGNKWGTSNPIMLRDNDFGVVRVRAFGTYDFKIVEAKTFLREVAGSDQNFHLDEFSDTMRSRIVSIFTDAIATAKIPVLDVASRYTELGEALLPLINPAITSKYGSRSRASSSRTCRCRRKWSRRSTSVQHGRDRQSQRVREVPDGEGVRERERRWPGRCGRGARSRLRPRAADDA
jgi:membrane protease subunit (stomatin/prohibitin family)